MSATPQLSITNIPGQPPASGMLTLVCLFFGNAQPFVVEITRDKLVDHLKQAIVAKEPSKFLGISPSDFIVSKVEIPDDEKAIQDLDFGSKAAEEMRPSHKLSKYFVRNPPEETIHILIILPGPSTISPNQTAELNRLQEFEKRMRSLYPFSLIVKPNRSTAILWVICPMVATLAGLTDAIHDSRIVNDTDRITLEANGMIINPRTDEDLRSFLQKLAATNQKTMTVDVKSKLKVFSEFRMEEVCALYGLGYDTANPLSQFPEFQYKDDHIDDELLSYLMQELNSRTALTPAAEALEAHHSIYVYCILHAVAKHAIEKHAIEKSPALELVVLAERYVEGTKAKGRVDYSIEIRGGEILGVTEVKKENYILGIAQNAMQIRSALESNKKRKLGIDKRCFGIATNAEQWYFLQYTPGQIPMISKPIYAMYEGKFLSDKVKKIAGILSWLLKVVSEDIEPQQKRLKLDNSSVRL